MSTFGFKNWFKIFSVIIVFVSQKSLASENDKKTSEQLARSRFLEAKKLIVNGFPDDANKAENLLIDAIRIKPDYVEAYAELCRFTLWEIANGLEEPSELYRAVQMASNVKELSVDRPLGDYLSAEIMLAAGQQQQAMNLFQETQKAYPDHIDTFVFQARFWSDLDPKRAITAAQVALAKGHPLDDLSPAISEAFSKMSGSKKQAAENILRFTKVYPDRWLFHKAASLFAEEKEYAKAELAYLEAVKHGNLVESRLQLAIIQYNSLNKYQASLKTFDDLKVHLKGSYDHRTDAQALIGAHQSIVYLKMGKEQLAVAAAFNAVSLDYRNETLQSVLYEKFKQQQKDTLLKSIFEKVVERHPAAENAYLILGNIAVGQKNYQAAVDNLSKAIVISPDRDELYSARAHALYELKNYSEALADFENAIAFRPSIASHYYNKACMLSLMGKFNDAIESLELAFDLDVTLVELAQRDEDLSRLKQNQEFTSKLSEMGVLEEPSGHASGPQKLEQKK